MVAPSWHAMRDRALARVDARLAEAVQLKFLKNGKADPDRESIEIEAILRVGGGKNTNLTGGVARNWSSRLVAGKAQLHIDRAAYTGPQPRKDDKVRAITRHGTPWFQVLHVDDRSHSRLVLELGEA